jgi:hypothetical protein
MWLLNTETLELQGFFSDKIPAYAILSHTWGDDELLFDDARHGRSHLLNCGKKALPKVLQSVSRAKADGWTHIWIDTCCIDKSSSSELSEAINSMFRWYQGSSICYAYLSDFDSRSGLITLETSRWFTRGWTLQELIAPPEVHFFDSNWLSFGTRFSLAEDIIRISGIGRRVFFWHVQRGCRQGRGCHLCFESLRNVLKSYSVATRMSWAANRKTSRIEDQAYSLLGLFDINMPMLYGEGRKAFQRLQEEIVRQSADQTILAWSTEGTADHTQAQVFASSPSQFGDFSSTLNDLKHGYRMNITNLGLNLETYIAKCEPSGDLSKSQLRSTNRWVAILDCTVGDAVTSCVALILVEILGSPVGRRQFYRFNISDDYILFESQFEMGSDTAYLTVAGG